MTRLRLTLEYDGGDFCGWQLQPERRSVQGVLEEAVQKITQESLRVTAAGRTDAGAHARGQVAHLDSECALRPLELRKALNAVLPEDLAVLDVEAVAGDFHARYAARSKRYVYRIWNAPQASPLARRDHWHLRGPLDLEAMRLGAGDLVGEHDFSAYRGSPGGAPLEQNPMREIEAIEIRRAERRIEIEVRGRSFLRYMVRNLVAMLVEVGRGQRPASDPAGVLKSRDRALGAATAPAHGLCLEQIVYAPSTPTR